MEKKQIKITIIEDIPEVRDGFSLLLGSMEGVEVVGRHGRCEDALKKIAEEQADVVLMDIGLPGIDGIECTQKIKKQFPGITILVITVHAQSEMVFRALCAGATGYITKSSDYLELSEAIEEVRRGGAPMSTNIARMVVESFQKNQNTPLTPRETEVLAQLAKGQSYTTIAQQLFVHKETVKSHIKNIYFKLQVNSKAEAIAKAIKNKFI